MERAPDNRYSRVERRHGDAAPHVACLATGVVGELGTLNRRLAGYGVRGTVVAGETGKGGSTVLNVGEGPNNETWIVLGTL